MNIPLILAHGSLGSWDELIFLGVAVIFLVMMGISWFKSRTNNPTIEVPADPAAPDENPPDHFRLD